MENREIEVKFLEIDKEALIKKLRELGAEDWGENLIKEIIFYDKAGKWKHEEKKFVRIRQTKRGIFLTYKHDQEARAAGTEEIEFGIDNLGKAKDFLEQIGLVAVRDQEKKRHTFKLGRAIIDVDTWPKVPTYVEIEGPSEEILKTTAENLGFDYAKGVFGMARFVIEKYYGIPVSDLKYFTFDKIE